MKRFFVCSAVLSVMFCTIGCNKLEWSDNIVEGDWFDAQLYCEKLEEKGEKDWRLPTIDELRTLVTGCEATQPGGYCKISEKNGDLSLLDITVDCNGCNDLDGKGHGKFQGAPYYFWSSSETLGDQFSAFGVNYRNGAIYSEFKHNDKPVRCVRGGKYKYVGETIDEDKTSGLKWTGRLHQSSRQTAANYCANSTYAGWAPWRLPTPDELEAIDTKNGKSKIGDTGCLIGSIGKKYYFSQEKGDDGKYFRCVSGKVFNIEDKESGLKFSSPQDKDFDCQKLQENNLTWREPIYDEKVKFSSKVFQWKGTKRCVNGNVVLFTDKSTGLMWSSRSQEMRWEDAVAYCKNLNEGNLSDWRLPTINELRTLIQNCPATEPKGACRVTNNCLSEEKCWNISDCRGCDRNDFGKIDSKYSKLGTQDTLWSSSKLDDPSVGYETWLVNFDNAYIYSGSRAYVRCVRSE